MHRKNGFNIRKLTLLLDIIIIIMFVKNLNLLEVVAPLFEPYTSLFTKPFPPCLKFTINLLYGKVIRLFLYRH